MNGLLLTGAGIGAATLLGSVLGCVLRGLTGRTYRIVSSIATGIMLCAAIHGLVLPALEDSGSGLVVCAGIGIGTWFLWRLNGCVARELQGGRIAGSAHQIRSLMFVLAIAIHHFPEGMAAGVSFGTGEASETVAVCSAIALQNIPEAMMVMSAMAQTGTGKRAAFWAAGISGGIEILGLVFGFYAVQLTQLALPLLLAFAAGAMLYVILENMLPEQYEDRTCGGTYGVLLGYCGMILLTDAVQYFS